MPCYRVVHNSHRNLVLGWINRQHILKDMFNMVLRYIRNYKSIQVLIYLLKMCSDLSLPSISIRIEVLLY